MLLGQQDYAYDKVEIVEEGYFERTVAGNIALRGDGYLVNMY